MSARLVGEGLFVREQHPLVGDRDDVVVERARRDRLLGLRGENRSARGRGGGAGRSLSTASTCWRAGKDAAPNQ